MSGNKSDSSSEAAPPAPNATGPRFAAESPYITDPEAVSVLDIPREYVRRMEDAQRVYGEHHMQFRAYTQAKSHGMVTLGLQGCWLGVGAWVISRGYRYSDPMNSIIARWAQGTTVRRLTTPISCLGLVIFSVTCTQLPYDVKLLLDASSGLKKEEHFMKAAMLVRDEAYREGRAAADKLTKQEHEALNALLTK